MLGLIYKNEVDRQMKDAAIDIIRNNIGHCQIEIYEGMPTGNVYIGMTGDDYKKLVEILGSL